LSRHWRLAAKLNFALLVARRPLYIATLKKHPRFVLVFSRPSGFPAGLLNPRRTENIFQHGRGYAKIADTSVDDDQLQWTLTLRQKPISAISCPDARSTAAG